MTICIASDNFPPYVGGIATFNKSLIELLTTAGHSVILLIIGYESRHDEEDSIITEGLLIKVTLNKTYFHFYNNWKAYFRPGGINAPNWIAIGLAMKEWLINNSKKYQISVIEASDYGGIGIFLCSSKLPPLIITGHGSFTQFSRYNPPLRNAHSQVILKLEELSFKHADAVVTHSLINKIDIENLFKRKVELISMPWTPSYIEKDEILSGPKIIVVGGLQPVKGIYIMAEAMLLLNKTAPGLKLEWIGGDTYMAPGQKKMSDHLAFKYRKIWQNTFIWKNEMSYENTQQELARAAIIVIPAIFETFNFVTLEAAFREKPMIITENTGASYLFTHGHDAWIIPSNNANELAQAIFHLISNEDLCKKLGKNARSLINNMRTEKVVEERLKVYSTTINTRKDSKTDPIDDLLFLKNYKTSIRFYYYLTRRILKKNLKNRNAK